MCIVNSHAAENSKRLDKVLIILCKSKIVELVDQLNNTNNLTRGILDRHAENSTMSETSAIIYGGIESWIFVGVRYIHGLRKFD